MLVVLARLLFWIGRLVAAACFVLAIYIAFNPAVAAPYGRTIGIFTLILFGACVWLIGRVARYISEE